MLMIVRELRYWGLAVGVLVAMANGSISLGNERCDMSRTKTILTEYMHANISSVHPLGGEAVLEELRVCNARNSLLKLYRQRDKLVLTLGGASWGAICKAVKPQAFVKPLFSGLADPDPRWRAHACIALGCLGDPRATPRLLDLLDDKAPVPGYVDEPPVAVFAASSLAALGRDDGVRILLDRAANMENWTESYLRTFQSLSGKDLGEDLSDWRQLFLGDDD
jgi:hypothetical protein